MTEPRAVRLVRYLMIAAAIAASPFYLVWILVGAALDRRGQCRCR